jgi:Right handed beta helix region
LRAAAAAAAAAFLCTMPASAARDGAPARKAPQHCTKTTGVGARLASVIASAARGSVVCLTGGDFGRVAIRNIHKAKPVVVRPVKGSSASVDLEIVASSGLRLVGLTISDLLMANSGDITLSHNTFTGMSLVQTQRAHANILFDSNRLDGNNAGPNDYEGRLTIRGYDNTRPVGVTISNNHFGGGCSDGVQVIGDAYGVHIGPGNEFTGIRQSGCDPVHADPIQLYGTSHLVVRGNYFHDNSTGIGSFDGDDYGTVSNNVFVCTCGYPYSVAAWGGHNWIVQHNTFAGGGEASFANANNGETASGNLVRDNVFTSGGGISAPGSTWGTNDHNLNAGKPGTGNITGRAIFVGGAKRKTYAGYRLAARSRGKGAASDGTDMGIRAGR